MKSLCDLCSYYTPGQECNVSESNCPAVLAFQQLMLEEYEKEKRKLLGLGEGEYR